MSQAYSRHIQRGQRVSIHSEHVLCKYNHSLWFRQYPRPQTLPAKVEIELHLIWPSPGRLQPVFHDLAYILTWPDVISVSIRIPLHPHGLCSGDEVVEAEQVDDGAGESAAGENRMGDEEAGRKDAKGVVKNEDKLHLIGCGDKNCAREKTEAEELSE